MSTAPQVKPGNGIRIKSTPISKRAIVYLTRTEQSKQIVSAIYFDDRKRIMADEFYWRDDHWDFLHSGPTETRAEAVPAAQSYIAMLESGQYPE